MTADKLLVSAPGDALDAHRSITELGEMCRDDGISAECILRQVEVVLKSLGET